jgi:calcineurin-like phosphoesterase family protein
MNIAVFSDVHGRILLAFALCARWERETGERIDLTLQAGDLGVYPDETRLDRATIKHAKADPEELGFLAHFVERKAEVAAILDSTDCPMIFVRGNHEDHAFLDGLEAEASEPIFPVDAYSRICCLKTGVPYTFSAGTETVALLGIGRVGQPLGAQAKPKYLQPDEQERLYRLEATPFDILLTHDVPQDAPGSRGMEEIRLVLDAYTPRYFFYGHTEEPYQQQIDRNGVTTAIRMADLNWERGARHGLLPRGVMSMLRWSGREDHRFEVVDATWLEEYSAWSWRTIAERIPASRTRPAE